MDPEEIDENLLNQKLKHLIFFTGLDIINNQNHSIIYNEFINEKRHGALQINYAFLTPNHEFFNKSVEKLSAINVIGGILKRNWSMKYLKQRPALIVCFVDIDWDETSWLEKKTECESKINSLRQIILNKKKMINFLKIFLGKALVIVIFD